MNAVSLSFNDHELEELRRAQRAHEPCMEEILASLRAIIADDKELLSSADPLGTAPRRPAAAAAEPQIVYLKEAPAAEPERQPTPEPAAPTADWSEPEPANSVAAPEAPREKRREEEPLLSSATEEAVASAFDALSAEFAARRAEIADEMTRELLRPMLKAWLDENLPGIVERVVRAEIERVARGPSGGALR